MKLANYRIAKKNSKTIYLSFNHNIGYVTYIKVFQCHPNEE